MRKSEAQGVETGTYAENRNEIWRRTEAVHFICYDKHAKVLAEDDDGWDVEAEVFGSGVEMWMRSQGDYLYKFERV